MSDRTVDYIVVGAGSAGCVLANRLTEDRDSRVLLFEAGGSERHLYLDMPAAFAFAVSAGRFDWGYETLPEPGLGGRTTPCPRGKVLGGSSSINAMGLIRGHRADYDRWAGAIGTEWSYAHCLPYFKKMERFSGGENEYRGGSGPLSVLVPNYTNPLYEIFRDACVEAGHPVSPDTNGAQQEGFGPMDQTIVNGRRCSTAHAYLRPAMSRHNLQVKTDIHVHRVLVENRRAVGIEYVEHGRSGRAFASREVILSAGAINSPKILMLSGIGPADALRRLDLPVLADLPGVGQNLQDHVDVSLKQYCRQPITNSPLLRPHRKLLIGIEWILTKRGPAATNQFEAAAYIRTQPSLSRPNVQLCFIPMLVHYDGSAASTAHGFQVTVMQLQPESRGAVSLASRDPFAAPALQFNYLSSPRDVTELREGIEALRHILRQPALAPYRGDELAPGAEIADATGLDAYIRRTAKSTHHPCCTCRMGTDADAVVSPEGRVHGIESLRVVDASIMPDIPSGNINAATIMIAEKLADRIRGRAAEPAATLH